MDKNDVIIHKLITLLNKNSFVASSGCTGDNPTKTANCSIVNKYCYKKTPFLKVNIFNLECKVCIIVTLFQDKKTANSRTITPTSPNDLMKTYDEIVKNVKTILFNYTEYNGNDLSIIQRSEQSVQLSNVLSESLVKRGWKKVFPKSVLKLFVATGGTPTPKSASVTLDNFTDLASIDSINLTENRKEMYDLCKELISDSEKSSRGGNKKPKEYVTIKGKTYVIHLGPRGGKYIMRHGKLRNIKQFIKTTK